MININCVNYKKGKCTHQAVIKTLFGSPTCILEDIPKDIRIPFGCTLQTIRPKPPYIGENDAIIS